MCLPPFKEPTIILSKAVLWHRKAVQRPGNSTDAMHFSNIPSWALVWYVIPLSALTFNEVIIPSLSVCHAVHHELHGRWHCSCQDQERCQSAVEHQPSQSRGHDTGAQQLYSYIHDLTLDTAQVSECVTVCTFVPVYVLTPASLFLPQERVHISECRDGGRTHCEVWGQGLEGRDSPHAERELQQTCVSVSPQNRSRTAGVYPAGQWLLSTLCNGNVASNHMPVNTTIRITSSLCMSSTRTQLMVFLRATTNYLSLKTDNWCL